MSKNEARHWIDQKHPNVLTDTKAEREMKSILEDLRITFLQDQHTNIEALNRKGIIQSFRFQLDFVLAPKEPYWVEVIEVNGPGATH